MPCSPACSWNRPWPGGSGTTPAPEPAPSSPREENPMDWLLRRLADRMGVSPPGAGESFDPRIRADHPFSQGMTLLIVGVAAAWIIWLYRREGSASLPFKM